MKPSLYLETTIPSFLVSRASTVLITAAHQVCTRRWWDERRHEFRLFTSNLVEEEILAGAAVFASQRLALVADVPQLRITDEVITLSRELSTYLRLPPSAGADAIHLATACQYGMDYLLTWNLKHIANAYVRRGLAEWHDRKGFAVPTICTPEELVDWEEEP